MKYVRLISSIAICELAGILGAVFTASSIDTWYKSLEQPAFAPPDWLFGPVWTTLYALMGISLYIVWEYGRSHPEFKTAIGLFAVQLILNAAWSGLFFGLQSPMLGLIGIILLWAAILATVIFFWRISKLASGLLFPYLAWVSFAFALNLSFFLLNR